jgi:hypothetical protein
MMRHVSDSEEYPTGPNQDAGFPSGSREVDAFCAVLGLTSQLDPTRIEALATELAAVASATAPPNQHGAELGRRRRPLLPRWRRRAALTTLMSSIVAKVAFATVAVASTTGGLAATGNLPDPAQQVLSDVALRVGIHIPVPAGPQLGPPVTETSENEEIDTVGGDSPATGGTRNGATGVSIPEDVPLGDPTLPDTASERARWVVDFVASVEATHGRELGKRIAEIASDGRSHGKPDGVGASDSPGKSGSSSLP